MNNPFSLEINTENRIYGLDVFRAVAILLVVLTHGGFLLTGPLAHFPWIRIIDGVELFFVLSGFLIGSILIKTIDRDGRLTFNSLTTFWKRRWFRTLPNYYLILLLNFLFVSFGFINGNLDKADYHFLFFLQNFSTPLTGFFWESWSLSIEEWFYIFFPVLSFVILLKMPSKKGMLLVIIILLISPLLYRIHLSSEHLNAFWWDTKIRKMVLTRMDTIIYGVVAAYIKFYYEDFWKKYRYFYFILGVAIVYSLIYIIPTEPNAFFTKTFYFSVLSFGIMLLLPLAESVKNFKSRLGKIVTQISVISYSMYLINLALVAQVIKKHFPPESFWDGLMKYAIFWVIVIGASILLFKYFEKPMMDLRDYKKKTTSNN